MLRRWSPLLSGLLLAGLLVGCGGRARGPYQSDQEPIRDIPASQALYRQACSARADEDVEEAELLLRRALDKDLFNGPAHNDLGVLLLGRGELYAAAHEFEWARKLMPGHPDPRLNQAITLELGGKAKESLDAAQAALAVQPGYLPARQAIAFIQVRYDLTDENTAEHLQAVVDQSRQPDWRDWARRQLLRLQ